MTIVVMRPRRTAVRWQRSSAGLFKGGVAEASQAEFFNVSAGSGMSSFGRVSTVSDIRILWPRKLIADTGYGAAEMLAWLVHERDIEPHTLCSTSQIEATVPFPAPTFL
jgi:hypothetical protein